MHIITKKRIVEAKKKYPNSISALDGWYTVAKKNDFTNFSHLKRVFNTVDKIGNLFVFDIGGNKLRLIASIHFNRKKLYIRDILNHSEYDKVKWRRR